MKDSGRLVSFMPTRRSNLLCHCKIDTEAAAQIFLFYTERVHKRKVVEDRQTYNDRVLHLDRVNRKLKNAGFHFHHVVGIHGWSGGLSAVLQTKQRKVLLLLSVPGQPNITIMMARTGSVAGELVLIQGKTMVCERGKYTTAQRNFESGLFRYKEFLLKEKRAQGVDAVETELSKLSHKTSNPTWPS